jgi:site-specific recombinase XerD
MGCLAVKTDVFFNHVESFMEYRKTVYEVSEETGRSNRADLKLFENFIKERNISRITGTAVMDFQKYLKKDRNNSGASVNRKIFTLRSYGKYFKLAESEEAGELPFQDVLKIRLGYRDGPHALSIEQVKVFFESIDRSTILGIRDYCIYALMYGLGLRIGEIHTLNLDNIDLDENTLHVIGKGKKRRTMNLTGVMPRILAEYLAVRDYFLDCDKNDALFLSKKGYRLSIRTMEDNFKKILSKSGIMNWFKVTCHTLRHSFASHLNDEDVDILVLQSLLGHSTPRSTELYIHPSIQKIREALVGDPLCGRNYLLWFI